MEKIKIQANKVGELVFSADTGVTYKKAFVLTWNILRETGLLLWLVICFVFVGGEWFWKTSLDLGRKTRVWYEGLQTSTTEEPKSATAMGQSALTALGSSTETLLYKAKKQLGMEAEPPAPKPAKPLATAPSSEPTPPPSITPPAATTPSSVESQAEIVETTKKSTANELPVQEEKKASEDE